MTARVPWYVWTSLASVGAILFGVYWDISWHMSIGRDTFWTPAHLMIQAGAIIAGSAGAYLIFSTTLSRRSPLRDVSIHVLGFRGPLGAFLAVWGAATMVVSAPFDNWWHNAYGLDVKILSPPHSVLTLGILGVSMGGVLMIAATLNRADANARRTPEIANILIGGMVLVLVMTSILEFTGRANLHRAASYRAIALLAPVTLVSFARVSGLRWAATRVAGLYTGFMIAMIWLFPLFPAEAKLGPVYQPITHYVPLDFPPLIIVPAIAIDLILARAASWRRWQLAPVLGGAFVLVLVAVQWPFTEFLFSDASRNWVFGTHYLPYFARPEWGDVRREFFPDDALALGMVTAVIAGSFASFAGLVLGDQMRKVKR
jgi:hypothetical protein